MNDLGVRPVPQQATPNGKPAAEVPLWILVTAVVVMLVLAAAAALALTHEGNAKEAARTYPAQWDPRVAPYVKVTQKLRGLAFLHPVEVRFLPPAEFEKSIKADAKDLNDEDREEIEQFTGLMRAFGMVKGDLDLFAAVNEVNGAGRWRTTRPRTSRSRSVARS